MAKSCFLIFPNQLFDDIHKNKVLNTVDAVFLIEDPLFFVATKERPFHPNRVKIGYMRACMKHYESILQKKLGISKIQYIDSTRFNQNKTYTFLKPYTSISYYDVCDHLLESKIQSQLKGKTITVLDSPMFFMTNDSLREYHKKQNGKQPRHASFYTYMKEKFNILVNVPNMDKINRNPPDIHIQNKERKSYINKETKAFYEQAIQYANNKSLFKNNKGDATNIVVYPICAKDANAYLLEIIHNKLSQFGKYQDDIIDTDPFLNHSVISPMLNIGLLQPKKVVQIILEYKSKNPEVGMNNIEGIIRQILGWREYMRYLYIFYYDEMIKSNTHNNKAKLTSAWYDGTTGIVPYDIEVYKAIQYGYAHHIIRLMIFLNIFILKRIHPKEIYKWFMEIISIDAYEWVMIPNIYAMGYFYPKAMSRPYISSSNYILKMSNYKKNKNWENTWDALYREYLRSTSFPALSFYKRNHV